MASADEHQYDEQLLTRYLLGEVSEQEAERLDESSIADAAFASHLDAVENDLVDAYVEGMLSGETLARFENFYLSSPNRREKVEFAKALLRFNEKTMAAAAHSDTARAATGVRSEDQALRRHVPGRWFTVPRLGLQWGFAAAAVLMFAAALYLFQENEWLQKQGAQARSQQSVLEQHAQALENELNEQRSANTGMLRELESLRASLPESHALKTIAVLLLAPTRGAGQIPSVSVPPGTEQVRIHLQLEPNDFRLYQVSLKDPSTNRTLWDASKLHPGVQGQNKVVSANVPARLLKQQNYVMELAGVPAQGNVELLTSYAFKVVLE
jgi:hypothetical protein